MWYKSKPKYIQAFEIDANRYQTLIEKGYGDFKIGDFLLREKSGNESIWPRKGFLALYEEIGD